MKERAIKRCINPKCGKSFDIMSEAYSCSCNSLLDVTYLDIPKKEKNFIHGEITVETYTMKAGYGVFAILLTFLELI